MFVAARGCDTFTPNIFSTQRNAKCKREPSPLQTMPSDLDRCHLKQSRTSEHRLLSVTRHCHKVARTLASPDDAPLTRRIIEPAYAHTAPSAPFARQTETPGPPAAKAGGGPGQKGTQSLGTKASSGLQVFKSVRVGVRAPIPGVRAPGEGRRTRLRAFSNGHALPDLLGRCPT